ncbi:hypothetical protein D3C86_1525080 [compost metagenome]
MLVVDARVDDGDLDGRRAEGLGPGAGHVHLGKAPELAEPGVRGQGRRMNRVVGLGVLHPRVLAQPAQQRGLSLERVHLEELGAWQQQLLHQRHSDVLALEPGLEAHDDLIALGKALLLEVGRAVGREAQAAGVRVIGWQGGLEARRAQRATGREQRPEHPCMTTQLHP